MACTKAKLSIILAVLLSTAGLLASARSAEATCVSPDTDSGLIPSVNLGGAALSAPVPHQTLSGTVVAAGGTLFIRSLGDHGPTASLAVGSTINGAPNPVELNDGDIYVFVVRQDGRIQKLNAAGGSEWVVDLRRSGTDSLNASAAVHLRRFASASFQAKYTTDLVYVATRYAGTGSTTKNRVYALNASTGAIVWTFNGKGKLDMDVAHAAPFLDYDGDRLIVGTDRTASVSQHSLWSIDVLTGTKAWSTNVGQLYAAPFVRDDTIYVATLFGEIKALSKTDGATIWSVATGQPILTDFFPEFRLPYSGLIAFVDFLGDVGLVRDDETSATVVWKTSGGFDDPEDTLLTTTATSRVAIDSDNGKAYVGAADGQLYQLSLLDGSIEATREVDSTGADVGDAGLVFEGGDVNIVVGSSSGELAKFCGPWTAEEPPKGTFAPEDSMSFAPQNMSFGAPVAGICTDAVDCGLTDPTPCANWACIDSVCVPAPFNEGGICDGDGNINTPVDICKSGTCIGQSNCQSALDSCKCVEGSGSITDRRLLIDEPSCATPPSGPGGTLQPNWCGQEISSGVSNNVCLAHESPASAVVWVHLLDQHRRPFVINSAVASSDIKMELCGLTGGCTPGSGNRPFFVDPSNPIPGVPLLNGAGAPTASVSLATGTLLASSRPGTYYAHLAPDLLDGSAGTIPWTIRTTVTKTDTNSTTCISSAPTVIDTRVLVRDAGNGNHCDFESDNDQMGFVRIRARTPSGAPLINRDVRLGYANDLRFAVKFEESITNTPSGTNLKQTDNFGEVTFIDYGNYMNGGEAQDLNSGSFQPMHVYVQCPSGLQEFPVDSSLVVANCL